MFERIGRAVLPGKTHGKAVENSAAPGSNLPSLADCRLAFAPYDRRAGERDILAELLHIDSMGADSFNLCEIVCRSKRSCFGAVIDDGFCFGCRNAFKGLEFFLRGLVDIDSRAGQAAEGQAS